MIRDMKYLMLFRIFIIVFGCLYAHLAIANTLEVPNQAEIGAKDIPTTNDTVPITDANQANESEIEHQNQPLDCNTLLIFEKRLVEAETAANNMSFLISSFQAKVQHLNTKLAEAKTKEEFEGYAPIINVYHENIRVVKKQRTELVNSMTRRREQIDFIKKTEITCESQELMNKDAFIKR